MDGWVGGWMDGCVGGWVDGFLGHKVDVPQVCIGELSLTGGVTTCRCEKHWTRDLGWVLPQSLIISMRDQVCPLWGMAQSENGGILVNKLL